ncbi:MAG: hypothetical protein KAJ10_02025 [Thermodesulfovibrionia bacterium]|nr:hypothetical protein [Thermodesulfovibrionia bacterium]
MSNNDQKSTFRTVDTGEKGEGTKQEEKLQGQILELASKLKNSIERRDKAMLKALLSDCQFWLYDRPGTLKEFLDALASLTGNCEEVELFVSKILGVKLSGDKATLSAETQLLWANELTWQEDELSSVMHLGFFRNGKTWKIDYMGFTPRQSPAQPSVLQTAKHGMIDHFTAHEDFTPPPSYFGAGSTIPFIENPAYGLGSYFATSDFVYQPEDEKTMPLIPVYIPEFVLIDVMKKLLKR